MYFALQRYYFETIFKFPTLFFHKIYSIFFVGIYTIKFRTISYYKSNEKQDVWYNMVYRIKLHKILTIIV